MDAHGFVRITGRVNDMIIRGGENLFPAEIENVVIAHPGVVEVAVIGVPDPFWGEVAIAFLRAKTRFGVDVDARLYFSKDKQSSDAAWASASEKLGDLRSGKASKVAFD